MGLTRILLLGDTHLGFDLPFRPRVARRRRGPDFFDNFDRCLEFARKGRVDLVVHGGDLLYRSRVPAELVRMAFEPLVTVADWGVPVYLVPGNHERSRIPRDLFSWHPNIHLFDRPRSFTFEHGGARLRLAGFPYLRQGIRNRFVDLVHQSAALLGRADARVLCMHHCVEGATVGPGNYTFRSGDDVVRGADIPPQLTAVLSGHIHRHQVLTQDLAGRPLQAPVFYPGSIERTAFAEKDEKKGFLVLEMSLGGDDAGSLHRWTFHELPARPMVQIDVLLGQLDGQNLAAWLQGQLSSLPPDAVVRVRVDGPVPVPLPSPLRAEGLRQITPPTMNLDVVFRGGQAPRPKPHSRERRPLPRP